MRRWDQTQTKLVSFHWCNEWPHGKRCLLFVCADVLFLAVGYNLGYLVGLNVYGAIRGKYLVPTTYFVRVDMSPAYFGNLMCGS